MEVNHMFEERQVRGGVPVYPDVIHYVDAILDQRIWEGDGWKEESVSWKETCYIHSGLSGTALRVSGPAATDFLSRISTNDVYHWKVGTMKHLVQLSEDGYVANHTLTAKDAEDSYRLMACPPWPMYMQSKLRMDVNVEFIPMFVHQISGPNAKAVIEKVTGEDISDVKFMTFRPIHIQGIEAELEIARVGMSGTIAYEIHGDMRFSADAYDAIYQTGKEYGMKRLGIRTYSVNHAEGGFPQGNCSFMYALNFDEGYWKMLGVNTTHQLHEGMSGSFPKDNKEARLRTPFDIGWGFCVKFDHDFIGREALEKIAENPPHEIVTLVWNEEDCMDVMRSMFGPREQEYKLFEYPCLVPPMTGGLADMVMKDGKLIGISSFPTYSYYYRQIISHCTIDANQTDLGNEVIVRWGDDGKNIKEIRAMVAKYPYTQLKRNQNYYDD